MRTHQRHLSHKQELLSPSLQFTSHFDLNWWFSWEVYTSVVPAESTCASGYKISHASGNTDKHNAMLLAVLNGIEIQPSSWKGYTNGWRKFAWLQHYYIYLMIIIFQTLVQSVRLVMYFISLCVGVWSDVAILEVSTEYHSCLYLLNQNCVFLYMPLWSQIEKKEIYIYRYVYKPPNIEII